MNDGDKSVDHELLKIIILMAGFAWITVFGLVGYIGIRISNSVDNLSEQITGLKVDMSQLKARVDGIKKE